ncbi:unnamed protein product [Coregonus sp. 'balchen']|nr:unnamed protein product [Coregonus sp. 'balchen']
MGNGKNSAFSKEILEDLKLSTKFTETEITHCFFFLPESNAHMYAQHVFCSFDTNDDGTLDFKKYIIALHLTSTGKTTRKLEWTFSLFDVDKTDTSPSRK